MERPREFKVYDSYKRDLVAINSDNVVTPGWLSLYSCGPTVYNFQHIGNYRAGWLPDMISRIAQFGGWNVRWVMNITDVGHIVGDGDGGENVTDGEDKIEKGARRENKTVQEIVDFYTDDFLLQCRRLNFNLPEGQLRPVASDYVQEQMMIALQLVLDGRAYFLDDGIYFDSEANTDLDLPFEILQEGDNAYTGRDIKNIQKNPADFALWKFVDPHSLQKWTFGEFPEALAIVNQIPTNNKPESVISIPGSPGWHSECVAMIGTLFGTFKPEEVYQRNFSFQTLSEKTATIDIHTGGEDHINVHHKNEILQSEALGFHLSKYWVHNKFVLVDGKKMSKSLGNTYHLNDIIEKGYDPLVYRMLLLEHHYSEQMNFTWDKMDQSHSRLVGIRKDVAQIRSFVEQSNEYEYSHAINSKQKELYFSVLADNLNVPLFLEKFQKLVGEVLDTIIKEKTFKSDNINAIRLMDEQVLALGLWPDMPAEITNLAEKRKAAKTNKLYQEADSLRDSIQERGWDIGDFAWGFGLWRVR
jgi:cysteinyl-tRNA synthetase